MRYDNKRYDDKGIAPMMLTIILVVAIVVTGTAYMAIQSDSSEELTGTLNIAGSTTVLPIAAAVAEDFMAENPDVEITVTGGGSSVGVKSVGDGTADIGMASRELKSSEQADYPDLEQFVVAKDGIAIIVHPDNPVSQMKMDTVADIYLGDKATWKDVGSGLEDEIVVVGRDSNSGTRATFDELVLDGESPVATMEQLGSNGEVHDKVATTNLAIGYVGLGYVDSEVKGLAIAVDGNYYAPTVDSVLSGNYPISRNLNMFTNGEPSELAQAFLDYCLDEGQAVVEEEGFVPLGESGSGSASGTLYIAGSTTVLPIASAAAEDYMAANSDAEISVSGGGSSVGVKAVGEGTAQIGMASRELKSSELEDYPDIVQHVIAKDGISVVVNNANTVTQLTIEQIKDIYLGVITDWADLGGTAGAIVVIGRDSNSGTRATFDELVLDKETPVSTMQQLASNGEVHDSVASTAGAIGYVGLGYIDSEVQGIEVSGDGGTTYVIPSVSTVQDGTYPISRSLNMFTIGQPTGLAKDFLDYLKGPEGQAIVADEGFVPIA